MTMKLPQIEAKINRQTGVLDLSMSDLSDVSFLKKLSNSKTATRITKIDLSDNAISELPDDLDFFPEKIAPNIKEIDFSSNRLKTIPKCLGALKNLQKLNFYSNKIVELPVDVFGRLTKLSYLDLSSNNNLDDKWRKLLGTGTRHSEMASLVKEWAVPEFTKLEKVRAKKQKQADKKAEKARLAEKAKQKEIRRKAWEEKQRKESEESAQAAGDNASADEDAVDSDVSSEPSEQEEPSALLKNPESSKKKGNFLANFLCNIVWNLVCLVVHTVRYSLFLVCSVVITVAVTYYGCTWMVRNDEMPTPQACPVMLDAIETGRGMVFEKLLWLVGGELDNIQLFQNKWKCWFLSARLCFVFFAQSCLK